jgi:uracil-DNA glycosylase family 4
MHLVVVILVSGLIVQKNLSEPGAPPRDCPLCPRLAAFRAGNRVKFPDFFNAPVPSFGEPSARLLIVGLAPGLKGANRTGRPFTGDFAGVLLYDTLLKFGFAVGRYPSHPDDELRLNGCRISNAVRCVPPENKPLPSEAATCNGFLRETLAGMPRLTAIVALGRIAHDATLRALGEKPARFPFSHGGSHILAGGMKLFGCYHCSRYNTSTGRLTVAMFEDVFRAVAAHLADQPERQIVPC